jgi:hypothetical protein
MGVGEEGLQKFRHYQLCQDGVGDALEMVRTDDEIACAAFDVRSGFFVELHILSQDLGRSTAAAKTFLDLAETATTVRHRCVLPVLDAGSDEGTPYYVTGLGDGEPLDLYIRRCAPVPDAVALGLAADLVSALQAVSRQAPGVFPYVEPTGLRVILEPPETAGPDALEVRGVLADLGLARAPVVGDSARRSEEQLCALVVELLREMLSGGSFKIRRELADAKALGDLSVRLAARIKEVGGREAVEGKFVPLGAFGAALLNPGDVVSSVDGLGAAKGHGIDGWQALLDGDVPVRVRELPNPALSEQAYHETARAATGHHAFPIACFVEQDGRLLVAEKRVRRNLATVVSESGGLSTREFMWIIQSLDRALEEASDAARPVWGILPEQIGISGNFEALHLRQAPTLGWLAAPYRYFADGHFPESVFEDPDDGLLYLRLIRSLPLRENPAGLAEVLGSAPVPQAQGGGRGGLIRRLARYLQVDREAILEEDWEQEDE